jgi:hypothetical protein
MFKLQAKQIEGSNDVSSEVFVIGELQNALKVANSLMDSTGCEFVEIFRKTKGEVIAVLKKAARQETGFSI